MVIEIMTIAVGVGFIGIIRGQRYAEHRNRMKVQQQAAERYARAMEAEKERYKVQYQSK